MRVQEQLEELDATAHLPTLPASVPVTRIESTGAWPSLKLREVWTHRELIYFLIWRDLKARYKQIMLGGGWAVIPPLFTMVIFSFFFGRLAKVPSDGIPYALFAFSALVPWGLFSHGLNQAAHSLVINTSVRW
jgi:lipopolysaccharide transport system permease protein